MQFETDFAGHPLTQRPDFMAAYFNLALMHEFDVAQIAFGDFFQNGKGVGAGHLINKPIVGDGFGVVATVSQVVVNPESTPPVQHEFFLTQPA